MGDGTMHGGAGLWATLSRLWRGECGLPVDPHVRADAGLPLSGGEFACRPASPFVGCWLR